jgi:hypothetical protein
MDFWRRAAKTSRILQIRNEVIREKNGEKQIILERMENSMLKWYGHVVCMEDNRWPKRIMTWSPGGRRRERSDVEKEKEVDRVMKQAAQ